MRFAKGAKLELPFPGSPYNVTEDLRKGQYCLQDINGQILKTAVNCQRLKLWRNPESTSLKKESVGYHVHVNWIHILDGGPFNFCTVFDVIAISKF